MVVLEPAILVLGGAFNPVHSGHIHAIEAARRHVEQLEQEEQRHNVRQNQDEEKNRGKVSEEEKEKITEGPAKVVRYVVEAAYLAAAPDGYCRKKYNGVHLSGRHRLEMCNAIANTPSATSSEYTSTSNSTITTRQGPVAVTSEVEGGDNFSAANSHETSMTKKMTEATMRQQEREQNNFHKTSSILRPTPRLYGSAKECAEHMIRLGHHNEDVQIFIVRGQDRDKSSKKEKSGNDGTAAAAAAVDNSSNNERHGINRSKKKERNTKVYKPNISYVTIPRPDGAMSSTQIRKELQQRYQQDHSQEQEERNQQQKGGSIITSSNLPVSSSSSFMAIEKFLDDAVRENWIPLGVKSYCVKDAKNENHNNSDKTSANYDGDHRSGSRKNKKVSNQKNNNMNNKKKDVKKDAIATAMACWQELELMAKNSGREQEKSFVAP